MSQGLLIEVDSVSRFQSAHDLSFVLVGHSDFNDVIQDFAGFQGNVASSGSLNIGIVNSASDAPFSIVNSVSTSSVPEANVSVSWDMTFCTQSEESSDMSSDLPTEVSVCREGRH